MTPDLPAQLEETEILLCQTEDGQSRLEVSFSGETCWLSLKQMAELFQRDKSVISRHIKNVFEEGELVPDQWLQILQQLRQTAKHTGSIIITLMLSSLSVTV